LKSKESKTLLHCPEMGLKPFDSLGPEAKRSKNNI